MFINIEGDNKNVLRAKCILLLRNASQAHSRTLDIFSLSTVCFNLNIYVFQYKTWESQSTEVEFDSLNGFFKESDSQQIF